MVLLSVIFSAAALMLAVIMWTPLRGWLGIGSAAMAGEGRTGYIGRHGSKGNLRKATFGKSLDVGIDNAGDVDASEAKFAEDDTDESDEDDQSN